MAQGLMPRLDAFIAQNRIIASEFPLNSRTTLALSALLLNMDGLTATKEQLKAAHAIFKRETPAISFFRGLGMAPIVTKLAVRDDPEGWMTSAKAAYEVLKDEGFPRSDYLALMAFLIAKTGDRVTELAHKGMELYRDRRKLHPMTTSSEDACYALFRALYKPDLKLSEEAELAAESDMKGKLPKAAMRSLGQIFSVGDEPERLGEKAALLVNALREAKLRLSDDCCVAAAPLCFMWDDVGQTVAEAAELDAVLRRQKGFSDWGIGRDARLATALTLIASDRLTGVEDAKKHSKLRDILQITTAITLTGEAARATAAALPGV